MINHVDIEAQPDAGDISMLTCYKTMNNIMAGTYHITKVAVHTKDGIELTFDMNTNILDGYEVEIRASLMAPFMVVAECFSVGKNHFKFSGPAIDLLEFRIREISLKLIQMLTLSGEIV